jgi:hypothetical protein
LFIFKYLVCYIFLYFFLISGGGGGSGEDNNEKIQLTGMIARMTGLAIRNGIAEAVNNSKKT